jgi:hypothetical protein
MIRMTASNLIAHRLPVLPLIVLLLSSCLPEQPNGIEGTGTLNTPPPPPPHGLTMTTARAEHTATQLTDGKVLIAGGVGNGFQALASAELYDPSAGTFTPTGDMTTARARHTAILLTNGKVLIAGGVADTQQLNYLVSAEVYDPSTGTFAATGNMISSGIIYSALLPDGRVFVGDAGNAEIYDPASGAFSVTGAYASSLFGNTPTLGDIPTLLPNGRVLVGETELFDPQTNTFGVTGTLHTSGPTPGSWPYTATLLTNGTVLFVEGNDSALPDTGFIYDPASGTLTYIGHTLSIHAFSTATRLPDGRVLIAGGQEVGGNGNAAVELYMPATGAFAPAATLTAGRHSHTATLLPDGTVLIAGGYSAWPSPTASAEIYK